MEAFETLYAQARAKFDADVAQAHADYKAARQQIDALHRLLHGRSPEGKPADSRRMFRHPHKSLTESTLTEAAERLLAELGPMTVVELTVALRERGCRANENPRKVANAIRGAFRYHPKRFHRDESGRWSIR